MSNFLNSVDKNSFLYKFLKKNLPTRFKSYIFFIRDFYKNIKLKIPKFILSKCITNVKNREGKNIYTMRNLGGSTAVRGLNMFTSDPEVTEWIDKFPKNSSLLDIGANVGVYSLYAAHLSHNVIALEPESLNFACLNLNIKDNNFDNKITAYPFCAYDREMVSHLNLKVMKFGGSGNSFARNITENGEEFKPIYKQGSISTTVDKFLTNIDIKGVNFIKIDVDGNELNVINGMTKLLKTETLKSIHIELNPNFIEHKHVFEILNQVGFQKPIKHTWFKGQDVFNYTFNR